MNGKKLIGMAVALVILAGIALLQKQGGKRVNPASDGDATLLDGIDLNAVTALEVTMDSNAVSLVKTDGMWKVEELSGYPVDFKKLANAIRSMAEVKLGKPLRTGNVEESELGFNGTRRKVVLKASDAVLTSIEVGARREVSDVAGWGSQHFVRKAGDTSTYMVDYDFRPFSEKPEDWIERQLLNIRSSDIVSIRAGDVVMKVDGADWKLVGLDEENEELQSAEANKFRSALQYLNCTTVADPGKSDAELGFTHAVVYTALAKDGLVYTVKIGGEGDGGRYARFGVAYEKPDAPPAPPDDAKQEKKDAYQKELETFNATCETNEKRVKELNSKLSEWTYVISTYDANDFLITRDKLAKAKEDEAPFE